MLFEDLRNQLYPNSRKRRLDFVKRTKHSGSKKRKDKNKRRARAKRARKSRKLNRLAK